MSRFRTMRIALLASTALVATVNIPALHADVTVSGGATQDLGGATVFHASLILEDGFLVNGTFDASESFDVSKGGVDATLTGLGTLFKTTNETVTLTGANTYTGGTSISAGILRLTGSGTLGASGSDLSIGSGGTLDLTNTTQTVGTLTLTDNASLIGDVFGLFPLGTLLSTTINVSTGAGTTALIDTNRFTFGTINKNGAGTLRLDAPGNFSSSGVVELNAGVLELGWQGVLGTGTVNAYDNTTINYFRGGQNHNNSIVLKAGTVQLSTDPGANIVQHGVISDEGNNFGLEISTNTVFALTAENTYTGVTTVNGGGQLYLGMGTTTGSVAGDIALIDGSLGLYRTDGALNITGNISGSGQVTTEFSFGSATLSGNNTFSGGIFMFGGTLRAGSSTAFGSGMIGGLSGTTFDLNGFDVSVGGITGGTGTIDLDGRTLTVTGVDGLASGVTLTAGNIAIAPSAAQEFSGVNLSPVSSLIVNGTALISGGGNTAPTSISLASASSVLDIQGLTDPFYAVSNISGSGSVLLGDNLLEAGSSNANATLSGTISGIGGSLKKVGSGILTLSGNNTFTGGIEVAGGTLSLASNGAAGLGSITTTGSVIDYGAGVNNAAPIILNSNTTQLQVTSSATQSGVISETGGSRPLEKIGNGVLTMTAANTYTGMTTISAGRIILSGAGEILGDVHIANNTPNDFFEISKSANWTYGGVISGYNVALTGSGTTTWTGENTHAYTGITDGTLTFSGAGTLGAANTWVLMSGGIVDLNGTTQSAGIFTLYDGGTGLVTNGNLNVSSVFYADSGTMAANLGGTGALAKFSAGTSIVSGSNSYGGQTLINGGTLVAQGGSAITDTSVVTIASGATLQIDSDETIGSLVGAGNVGLGSNTLTTGVNNADTTFTGVIAGSGGLEKAGTGIFTLTGAHTYTGLTTVSDGRLQLGTGGTIAGDIHVVDNGLGWFDFVQSGSYTYSGVLSGGQISQSGAGTTTLTGANTNSYLGIGQGTLTVSGLGTIGASNMDVGLSGFGSTATLDLGGTTQNISLLTMFDGYDNAVVNGTLNASTFLFAEEGLISANLTGTATLVKNGSGTTTLSGSNTYTGQTTINAGTLVLQGGNAIDNANAVTIGAGATLQLDGDETIGSLAGAGNLALTTKSLTAGGNNGTTLFTGTIFGGATSSLQKAGTGTLHIVGSMNQESTTVTAGQLNFNGTALGNIAVNAGAVLSGTNTINGNLINLGTVSSGNSPGTTTVLGNYTGGGTLDVEVQFDNAGSPVNGITHDFLDIAGNVLGAPTTVNLLTFAPSGAPAATVGNGIQIVRVGGTTTGSDFTMTSYLLGSYYYDVAYIANYSGSDDGYFLQSSLATPGCSVGGGDDACFIDNTTNQTTPVDALGGNDTLQLTGATNFNFDVSTIGTVYTNFENYQKADTSIVTLTGLAGLTSLGFDVQNGTLVAGTGQLGSLGANNILTPGILDVASTLATGSIAGTGSVVLNANLTTGANDLSTTFSGIISGAGGLTKVGLGTFTLSGSNSYTGGTTINGGTLAVSGGSALDDFGAVVVSSGAVLDLQSSETIGSLDGAGNVSLGGNLTTGGNDASTVYSGSMSGAGQLVKTGTGAMTLTGANTHTGGTNITGGILQVSGVGTLGAASGSLDLSAGAGLDLGGTSQTVGSFTSSGAVYNGTLTVTGLTTLFAGNASANLNLATLNKSGAGAATLSGTNSTGAVNVLGGSLVLSGGSAISDSSAVSVAGGSNLVLSSSETIGSLTGAGGVSLGGGTLLTTGGDNSSTTFSGAISGTGKLVKTGSGLFTLGGLNSFTGGIDIVHGGIRLLNSNAAGTGPITTYGSVISYANAVNNAAPIIVSSNTTQLEVLAADVATQSGAISEAGGSRPLEKIGTGTLTLSGFNSYTGATTITAGTLNVTGGSALSNSAAVNIAGAGTLSVTGSETIGSLSGSGTLSLGAGATLTTGADNTSSVFSGTSSGLGDLTKTGAGTMTLTGTNSFAGVLAVAGGNLTVTPSGSLNGMSSFSVLGGASAFLGGSVQGVNGGGMTGAGLGALSVNASGTLYLDDNTSLSGTTLNLASGSNLNLFLTTNTSQYPQISLSGSANIANANVGVYLDPISFSGTLATSFTYSNVITGSGVTGTFGTVNLAQSPSGLFTVAGIYTPTSAGLQVTRNAFSTLGGNGGNQDSVGDALEEIFVGEPTDPDLINLYSVIGSTPAGDVPAIYTAISGAENAENTGNSLRTDDPWKQSVAERVNAARTTGCTVAGETWCLRRYAQATTNGGDVMSDIQGDPTAFDWLETGIRDAGSFSVWGRIIGAWGETSGDVNGPGSTQTTGGFIGGADHVFNSLLLAGVAMQYVETDVDYDQSRNGSLIRSGQMGAYVSYGGAEAFVNGNISVIGSQASAKRFMSIGLLEYDVESLARSWTVTASVEGGTIMEIDGYRFEPSMAFNYQAAHPLDFEEKGGGGLSLIVRPDDSQSLRSILSARLSRVYDVGDRKLVPQLRIDWRHEMLDRRQEFSAAFAGDPTVFFDIDGAVYARDVFAAGASVTMPITGRITGYVDAQGAFSEDSTSAMVSVGGRATW